MSDASVARWSGRRLVLPEDIDDLVGIAGDENDPATAGMSRAGVEAIWSAALRWFRSGTQPFISLCLRRRGRCVIKRSVGFAHVGEADAPDGVRVGHPDTPVALFSASKMVTALLIHGLAERGELALDERVSTYLPGFAREGKKSVTVRDILTHRAGIPRMPDDFEPELVFDFDATLERLCAAPGTPLRARRQAYHAATGGFVLGAVARAVASEEPRELLREMFAQPLGLDLLGYGIEPNRVAEVATNYSTGPDQPAPLALLSRRALGADWHSVVDMSNRAEFFASTIPAVNVVTTADDVSKFMQMLLNGGQLDDTRVLSEATVRSAIAPTSGTGFDRTLLVPMRYSAGLMLGNSPVGLFGPMCRRAFGHLGFINIFVWADPDRDIAAALLSTGKSLYGSHLASLIRLLATIGRETHRT